MYMFPLNKKVFLKGMFIFAVLAIIYVFYGFMGTLFFFFFLSLIDVFHRMKNISIIYNMYIKTIIHFCGITQIHHVNFAKFLNI